MKLRILFLLGCASWIAPAQPACHSVEGDRIRAEDVAAVLPEFRAVPAETLLGQAPLPGSQRVFRASELIALAHRFGAEISTASDVCFEWPMQPIDRAQVLAAMQESLALPDAKIEIADLISDRVPAGKIDFPLSRLGKPSPTGPAAPVLWRGDVIYGDNHRFAIWAKVELTATCQRWVATESLTSGKPIEARQVRATTAACFPGTGKDIVPVEEIAGRLPIRAIPSGSEVRPELIVAPNDVNRGDAVRIEVHSGAARLAFTGKAESAGHSGDFISVRNPDSNKSFQARITGKDTAVVEVSLPKGI